MKQRIVLPPSVTLFCTISSTHGGPSEYGVSGLLTSIVLMSSCLYLSTNSKKLSSLAASPFSRKAYLVVLLQLKYGKF